MIFAAAPAPAGAASDARESFEQGVAAAGDGDSDAAIRHFEAARRQGLDTGALHFNLAVAYYRTGRTDAAVAAFRRAAASDTMVAPALYQLGRIARERGDSDRARAYLRRAAERAQTERLRSRALAALGEARSGPRPPDSVYVAAGAGHESNVALAPSDVAGVSDESAGFVDASVSARVPLGGSNYLRASGYLQHFRSASDFDLVSLRAGVGRVGRLGVAWRWSAWTDGRHQRFGGDDFETSLLAGGRFRRELGDAWRLGLGYRLELARGGSDFAFLDGTGHRFEAALTERGDAGWRLEAAAETLERDDLDRGDDFFSFSRDGLELRARRAFALPNRVRLALEADWAHRRYDGAEVRDGARLRTREDDRVGLGVELDRRLGDDWSVRASLRAEERDSNVAGFDYERTLLDLRLERLF